LIPTLLFTFPNASSKKLLWKIQPILIIGTFYFGVIHAYISFFQQLGGFEGLSFLGNNYLLAISFSATALILLLFLSSTVLFFEKRKKLHSKLLLSILYIIGILILLHALLLGTHFQNLSGWIPQIIFFAIAFLSILLAVNCDNVLSKKFPSLPKFGIAMIILVSSLLVILIQSLLLHHQC
jgi:hypothetical protein